MGMGVITVVVNDQHSRGSDQGAEDCDSGDGILSRASACIADGGNAGSRAEESLRHTAGVDASH